MKFFVSLLALAFVTFVANARSVESGTVVANPGAAVAVPIVMDEMAEVESVLLSVNYDPTVVVLSDVDQGVMAGAGGFVWSESGRGVVISLGSINHSAEKGALAVLHFVVRPGTAGLFSDVTIADCEIAGKDGVTDISATNPLRVRNGMIRSMASDAAVARLEEQFTVWPETELASLTLADGDGIRASDAMMTPIAIAGSVTASGAIPVAAPEHGWQSGRYVVLSATTAGLLLLPVSVDGVVLTAMSFESGGVTTYCIDATVEGEVEIVSEDGELAAELRGRIRSALAGELAANPSVTKVVVKGGSDLIPIVTDLGIVPTFMTSGATATAVYEKPVLAIVEFQKNSGRIRVKVTPGEGNAIRSNLATGCLQVYGSAELIDEMTPIEGAKVDLAPYLKMETEGEVEITASFGSKRFFRVKAAPVGK